MMDIDHRNLQQVCLGRSWGGLLETDLPPPRPHPTCLLAKEHACWHDRAVAWARNKLAPVGEKGG